jgi:hypothetical protein
MAVFAFAPILILIVLAILGLFIGLFIKKPKLAIILPIIILFLMFFIALPVRVYREQQYRPAQELQNNVTASPFGVSPILILIVFTLLVLLITLLVKKPKFAIILVFIPIIFIFLWFYTRVPVDSASQITRAVESSNLVNASASVVPSIWSEGIEEKFKADVYPSKMSAVRSLGRQIKLPVKLLLGDQKIPNKIIILRDENYPELIDEFAKIVRLEYPEIPCEIISVNSYSGKPDLPDEVSILLKIVDTKEVAPWQKNSFEPGVAGKGKIEAMVVVQNGNSTISEQYMEKPWLENFSHFANLQSNKQYIVARSNESSLIPEQANQQAINDAWRQLNPFIAGELNNKLTFNRSVTFYPDSIINSGMIVDKFVQSFDGTAGKIWREALLLDVSADKLQRLTDNIAGISRSRINNWAQIIFSILGMLLLITVVYIFLNAATKGYYNWSLRIVGAILALILLFIILSFA